MLLFNLSKSIFLIFYNYLVFFFQIKLTGQRLLTISPQERDSAIYTYGYSSEGVVGATIGVPCNFTSRVYRYYNASKQDWFYTNNYNELGAGGAGYTYEGIAWQ